MLESLMAVDFTQRRNCSYFLTAISSAQSRKKRPAFLAPLRILGGLA